jgi:hypothetical protein
MGQCNQDGTTVAGQPWLTVKTGYMGQVFWDKTTEIVRSVEVDLTGNPGRDKEVRTARTSLYSKDSTPQKRLEKVGDLREMFAEMNIFVNICAKIYRILSFSRKLHISVDIFCENETFLETKARKISQKLP